MAPMNQPMEVSYCIKLDLPETKDGEDLSLYSARTDRTEQLPSARLPKKLQRPSKNLLFDAPTPAAVGILGEAAEEVMGLSIPASPREDGEAWLEAGPLPGPAPERYADKAQGLSLAQRLLQLDFSDDEEDDGSPTSRHELPKLQAEPDAADTEAAEASPIIVEDCQEFIQELDSDDD
ncbi:unnamed protein product [Symbiodinium sp. CCMP2456]|nr:unnamed protein product [Symbiodinium sp. CCMP2456]